MDFSADVVAFQLAQEWEALTQAAWAALAWTAALGGLGVMVGVVVTVSGRALRPRRFWCRSTGRDVEVLFEESGPPGFRQIIQVATCSTFESPSAIACRRACVDETCRGLGAPFGLARLHEGRAVSAP